MHCSCYTLFLTYNLCTFKTRSSKDKPGSICTFKMALLPLQTVPRSETDNHNIEPVPCNFSKTVRLFIPIGAQCMSHVKITLRNTIQLLFQGPFMHF